MSDDIHTSSHDVTEPLSSTSSTTPTSIPRQSSTQSCTSACIHVLETPRNRRSIITSLAIHDTVLYAGSSDGHIFEYDIKTYTLQRTLAACASPSTAKGVTCIHVVYPRLLSSSEDGSVVIWNLISGSTSRVIQGHDGHVTSVCASADGKLVYSGGADRLINEWCISTG